jgi:hypothetical protein
VSIDDKLAQAKALVQSDERERSVGLAIVTELLRLCNSVPVLKDLIAPISDPLHFLLETLQKWRLDNTRYLVDVIIERVQEIGLEVQCLSANHKAFIEGEWIRLVLDGVAKAQQARARERVKRLGQILAYAYAQGDRKAPELTEELLRVAAGLDEDDVRVLAWLCDGMKDKYSAATGEVDFEGANDFWGQVDLHGRTRSRGEPPVPAGLSVGDLMGCCAKLQAFGLILQVRQNEMKVAPSTLPYTPLKRGYEFLEYVRRG